MEAYELPKLMPTTVGTDCVARSMGASALPFCCAMICETIACRRRRVERKHSYAVFAQEKFLISGRLDLRGA